MKIVIYYLLFLENMKSDLWQKQLGAALEKISFADHMLTITYPMVKEPKLLLNILKNIFESGILLMSTLSEYKFFVVNKKDPVSVMNNFKINFSRTYKIPSKFITSMDEIKVILKEHEKSAVEFTKKDNFIICDDEYAFRKLNAAEVKKYVDMIKEFYNFSKTFIEEYER